MHTSTIKVLSALALSFAAGGASGESPFSPKPIWAKDGRPLALDCRSGAPAAAQSTHGDASVSLECGGAAGQTLRVRYKRSGTELEIAMPLADMHRGDWRPQEILWAPDGLAFLINGSENAYSGSDFVIFQVRGNALVRSSITGVVQTDMVGRLAKCWPYIREITGGDPQFNMSAISWSGDTLAVFAEVPCTATFENSMCSVYGYEMNARSGEIVNVLSEEEVRKNWRAHMSWSMTEPTLPTCDPKTGKVHER